MTRIEPPAHLTPEQGEVWRGVIASKPAEWFDSSNEPLLIAYCRNVIEERRLGAEINEFQTEWLRTDEGLKRYEALSKAHDRLTKTLVSLARSMRLTQQAKYRADAADVANRRSGSGARRPWETVQEDDED